MTNTRTRAKAALLQRFCKVNPGISPDKKGYVSEPGANLIDPAWLGTIKDDLGQGAGNELRSKFCAVHSSAAMAVNHFADFKNQPQQLVIAGHRGFTRLVFEQQLRTGLGGTPPHLDVFLESSDTAIAIESKLTETLSPKKPKFSPSYQRSRFPDANDEWWQFIEDGREGALPGFLDIAQLVKHYLGLLCFLRNRPDIKRAVLTYLYWKPTNADKLDECREHERELEAFKARVGSGRVDFVALSYRDLWREWQQEPDPRRRVEALRARYSVEI